MSPLPAILAAHKRLAIVGGPGTGKTTLAARVDDRAVLHTDDTTIGETWHNQPAITIRRANQHERVVIEGVQVARALRKGLKVDAIIILEQPKEPRTPGQEAMARGQAKIVAEALAANPGVAVYREQDL